MKELRTHLIGRGMDPELYNVQYDLDNQLITFYLHNGAGNLVGYQQYNPNELTKNLNDPKLSRYFTHISRGRWGMFGVEQLDMSKPTIYVVEGIFKAGVLHRLGFNALAVLTDSPTHLKSYFRILRATHDLIAIGDPDAAGERLVEMIKKGFTSPLDLDEMEDSDVLELLGGVMSP